MNLYRVWCVVLRCALALLCGVVFTLVAAPASAEPVRVVVIRPEPPSPLLEEALIRMRGELSAVGLGVELRAPNHDAPDEPPAFGPLDYGILELKERDSLIEIRAYAPELDAPVIQTADPAHRGINAEVIAIRAVEALRAAMIQYVRREQTKRDSLPKSVSGFTKLIESPLNEPEREKSSDGQKQEPISSTPDSPPDDEAPPTEPFYDGRFYHGTVQLSFWFGGSALIEMPLELSNLGAQAGVYVGNSAIDFGLVAETSLLSGHLEQSEGEVWVHRTAFGARLHLNRDLSRRAFVFLGLGFGAVQYRFETFAASGYRGQDGSHWSALASAELGLGYWFVKQTGVFASVRLDSALDAPELFVASESVTTLEQPSYNFSFGFIVGRF